MKPPRHRPTAAQRVAARGKLRAALSRGGRKARQQQAPRKRAK